MRILGFGTYDRHRHPRVGVILDGLVELGHEVVEANTPMGLSTAERVRILQHPWLAYRLVTRLARSWLSISQAAWRARRGGPIHAVVVGYLGHFDVVLARVLFPRTPILLDLLIFAADTATDRGTTSRAKLMALGLLDRLAVRCADVVMVDTAAHAALLAAHGTRSAAKALVVPVGATREWYEAARPVATEADRPLRVVFFGLFTPLQGAPVVGRALRLLADDGVDVDATMAGTGQDYQATRSAVGQNPRVSFLDWVQAADLPGLVAGHDVCLGIFGTSGKAQRVVPNKVYQGAAAGCALVTSATGPQLDAFGGAASFVDPGDPVALAATLTELAGDRPRLDALRRAARERAVAYRPAAIASPLVERLARRYGQA